MEKTHTKVRSAPHKAVLTSLFVRLGKGSKKDGRKVFNDALGVSYQRSTNWLKRGLPVQYVIAIAERWGVPIDALARDDGDLQMANEYFHATQSTPAH